MADRALLAGKTSTLKVRHAVPGDAVADASLATLRAAPPSLIARQHTKASILGSYRFPTHYFLFSNPILSYLRYTRTDSVACAICLAVSRHTIRLVDFCNLDISPLYNTLRTMIHPRSHRVASKTNQRPKLDRVIGGRVWKRGKRNKK